MPAIPYKHSATTDVAWDAGENEKRLKADDKAAYRDMYAWVDPKADPTTKSAYKFPHHMVSGDGKVGAANTRACSAVIAALNGGRGGANIPGADRKAVYNAVAHHLRDAGKDVPELKSDAEIDQAEQAARQALEGLKPSKIERRLLCLDLGVKKRSRRDAIDGDPDPDPNAPSVIHGHAAVFEEPTDLGYFTETVKRGAFTRTLEEDDIRCLFNHDSNHVLARNMASTLQLREDFRGLYFEAEPPDTQFARDLMTSIERGDISGCSIGFSVRGYNIRRGDDGSIFRDLTDLKLFDVSPVTYPAYESTDVNVRSLEEIVAEFRHGPDNPAPSEEAWRQAFEHRRRLLQLAE